VRLSPLLAIVVLVGCADPPPPGEVSPVERRTVALFAGATETCALVESTFRGDAGVRDLGTGGDLGSPIDGGAVDGGSTDGGAPETDMFVPPADMFVPADMAAPDMAAPDMFVPTDGGPPTDAGAPTDAGTAIDAGTAPPSDGGSTAAPSALSIRCWGAGQASPRRPSDSPEEAITAATWGTRCVVDDGGRVICWGPNESGQTGAPANEVASPAAITLLPSASGVALAVGGAHACALTEDGLYCWGAGDEGQLGDGRRRSGHRPVPVDLEEVTDVALGERHTCAIAGGELYCWGASDLGQAGRSSVDSPQRVRTGLGELVSVVAGRAHTCVLDREGEVACLGDDSRGQLGQGTPGASSSTAVDVSLPGDVTVLAAGTDHSCAAGDGTVYCWGAGDQWQTGTSVPSEGSIERIRIDADDLALGSAHSCALSGEQVRCWGANDDEQLGGDASERSATPVRIGGLR
jgi:alpha-tubulin suppressor-like RCC1 family protein